MLDVLRRGQRWIMPALLLGISVPFVAYFGFQSGGSDGTARTAGVAIRVGKREISVIDLQRSVDQQLQRYRESLGNEFDERSAQPFLVNQAASGMLRSALLAHLGEQMGLRVSDAEVLTRIRSMPGALDEKGQVNREALRTFAEREFGTERRFHEMLRDELLAAKTARLIEASVAVSDSETRDAIRTGREEVQILAVRLDGTQPRADLKIPEDAGTKLLARDSERVRKAVEERKSQLDTAEQVRARHILVSLVPGFDEAATAAARARIDAIKVRLEAGEDFAAVAKEVSDDQGTKENGGDLGFFQRGAMVKGFEEAAFALEPGKLSGVVETDFGLHLIRVEEKKAASVMPYPEASAKVALELARIDAAAAAAKADADALSAAVKAGKSLEDAAREKGASILRPPAFRRNADGYIPELGQSQDIMTAAFALSKEKPVDATVHVLGENVYVLIQAIEKKTPTEDEIDAALPLERERVLGERRMAVENAWLEGERKRLEASNDLAVDVSELLPKSAAPTDTNS